MVLVQPSHHIVARGRRIGSEQVTWTVRLLVDPLGALAVRCALVIVMTSRRAVLAQDLVATSLVLYPRRVAAVW